MLMVTTSNNGDSTLQFTNIPNTNVQNSHQKGIEEITANKASARKTNDKKVLSLSEARSMGLILPSGN